jgi:hypothetical protein
MKRSSTLALALTAAAVSGLGAGATLLVMADPESSRVVSPPASYLQETLPSDGTTPALAGVSAVKPGRVLPPIAVEESWLTSTQVGSMATGVLWVEGRPQDVDVLLDSSERRRLFDEFEGCFPAREQNPTANELFRGKEGCFDRSAIEAAAASPSPVDVFVALRALSLARPDVFTLCHNASHRVGEIAMRRLDAAGQLRRDEMREFLDQSATTCQGGLVHGLYDALGYMGASLEEFEMAIGACEDSQVPTGQCADAVGHAAWDSLEDVVKSLGVCALWSSGQDQDVCAEGVLMRIYQRLEPTDQFYTGYLVGSEADRFIAETAALCSTWPTTSLPGLLRDNPQHLCNKGIVYLLVKPAFAVVQSNGGDFTAGRAEIYRLIREVVDACSTYDTEGRELCIDHLAPFIVGFSVFERSEVKGLCAQLPVDFRARCERDGISKIESVESGRG